MSSLENEVKELVITVLNLEHLNADEISYDIPLFDEGLGLDSIDALELGVAIKKKYNVSLDIDKDENVKKHFYSIQNLANFIRSFKGGNDE